MAVGETAGQAPTGRRVISAGGGRRRPAEEAVQALVRLGYPAPAAEDAVRSALADGHTDTARLVRQGLQALATRSR